MNVATLILEVSFIDSIIFNFPSVLLSFLHSVQNKINLRGLQSCCE